MKELLNAYYENTVIPAMVCGSITSLSLSATRYLGCGFLYLWPKEVIFLVLFFLVVMTAVDAIKLFKEMVEALDALEGGIMWD